MKLARPASLRMIVPTLVMLAALIACACGEADAMPSAEETPPATRRALALPTPSAAATTATPDAVVVEGDLQVVTLRAGEQGNAYYYSPSQLQLQPGHARVRFVNEGVRLHTFNVKEQDTWTDVLNLDTVNPGEEATIEFIVPPQGTYVFYCILYGHLNKGQSGILTVKP